jgi:AraC-like DNA-binding protein
MTLKPTMLVSWGARAIYIGPGFQLPAHRNAVAVLAIALQTPMRVAFDAHDLGQGFKSCRSVLIEPNCLHLIETINEDYAFIYVDALSHDFEALRSRCFQPSGKLHFDLKHEDEVIDLLVHMQRNRESWTNIQETLAKSLGFDLRKNEPRITLVVEALLSCPSDARSAEDWAREIGLSSSRFQHLFKETAGISFRRFRLWARMRFALAQAMRGSSLTNAAMQAGLSSSAHLSTAFKDMFGMSPSQLIDASPLYIEA